MLSVWKKLQILEDKIIHLNEKLFALEKKISTLKERLRVLQETRDGAPFNNQLILEERELISLFEKWQGVHEQVARQKS